MDVSFGVCLITAAAALLVGFACGCRSAPDDEASPAGDSATEAQAELAVRPSALARRSYSPRELKRLQEIGDRLQISWTVLAAAQRIESGGRALRPAVETSHALAIAYTLQALNGPADYEAALAERGGGAYAHRVLALSSKLGVTGAHRAPSAELPLRPPAAGPIIAAYGQRYGVLHDGVDFDASTGAPLRAAADGLVLSTTEHPIFGLYTCIGHRIAEPAGGERALTTCYGNQSRFAVRPGDRVDAGQLIGRVGCTGTCLRPHVHFQVRLGSDQNAPTVDPAPYLAPSIAAEARGAGPPLETQP